MKKFQIATLIISGVAGIITLILAILGLADVANVEAGAVLKYIVAATLIIDGVIFAVLGLTRDSDSIRNLLSAAISIGVAIFLFLDKDNVMFDSLFVFIIPIVAAAFGAGLLVKSIVQYAGHKSDKHTLFFLIIGITLLAVGITFAVLAYRGDQNIQYVVWLLVGVGMIAVSASGLSKFAKH